MNALVLHFNYDLLWLIWVSHIVLLIGITRSNELVLADSWSNYQFWSKSHIAIKLSVEVDSACLKFWSFLHLLQALFAFFPWSLKLTSLKIIQIIVNSFQWIEEILCTPLKIFWWLRFQCQILLSSLKYCWSLSWPKP